MGFASAARNTTRGSKTRFSAAGLIRSAWRYEGGKRIWDFVVPEGATATVTIPGEKSSVNYSAGSYRIER